MSQVPELEDVPHVIKRIKDAAKTKDKLEPSKQNTNLFAGFKKGFFRQTVQSTHTKKPPNNLTYIKGNSNKNNLVIPEVQNAMKEDYKIDDFQNDLTSRLKSNTDVSNVLENPFWLSILNEFQQDAEKAMEKYKNNDTVKNTMLKLCNVFGDSFLHMHSSGKNEDEQLIENLVESPLVKEALLDPYISLIMDLMKENKNDIVMRMLKEANSAQKQKIQVLVDHGLFTFQA